MAAAVAPTPAGASSAGSSRAAPEYLPVPHQPTPAPRIALTQIVPTLPPAIDGLGDYADILGHQLHARHGVPSRFLIVDPAWSGTRAEVVGLPQRTAPALLECLARLPPASAGARQVVILHYVNYAYDPRRGLPRWLVAGLEQWTAARAEHRLITVFHELYATSWPNRKAFWYSPFQRRLSARLCRASAATYTSREYYARWIRRHLGAQAAPCQVWPVLSNVGEPAAVPPMDARQPWLVVFGQQASRSRIYQRNLHRHAPLCERLGITEIHDIGTPTAACPRQIGAIPVHLHGRLDRHEISALLLQSRFGLIDNNGASLAKSGVFAAYCSHGLVPLTETDYPAEDGLVPGQTMIGIAQAPAAPQPLASAAFAWYQRHASPTLADAMHASLHALLPAGA